MFFKIIMMNPNRALEFYTSPTLNGTLSKRGNYAKSPSLRGLRGRHSFFWLIYYNKISNAEFGINRFLLYVFLIFNFINIFSQNIDVYNYKTGNFELIYYGSGYRYLIPHTARAFNLAMNKHIDIFDYHLEKRIPIFINDFTDYGNGGAIGIPFNFVMVGINPFDNIYEIMPANERMVWLASHELTHIVMSDKPGNSEKFFRNIFFGKPINDNSNPMSLLYSYLASPRWYSPRWFHEGIAIFMETIMNAGSGRLLGGYDEMVFRTMILDSSYFYKPVGLETEGTTIDFKVGANAYLYGTRFVSYLASKYGYEKLFDFYSRSDSSNMFFASQFSKVYDKDILDVWDDWNDYERKFQAENIKLINQNPITKHEVITEQILGSASRQFYDKKNNKIIAGINYPGILGKIANIDLDNGQIEEIVPVKSPRLYFVTNIAYDDSLEYIFYNENNNNYKDLVIYDNKNGKEIKKHNYLRFGDFVINKKDKSLWGIRNYNGRSSLSRMLPPYNEIEELYAIPFGYTMSDLDISHSGELLSATYTDLNGDNKIIIFKLNDILQGIYNFEEIYEFEDNSANNFTFSFDDKYLFGTSYYTGVSNIFRINISTKEPEILTNTERGYFRPMQFHPDSLIAYSYSSKGLTLVKLAIDTVSTNAINLFGMNVFKNNPELYNYKLAPISSINLDSIGVIEEDYNTFKNLQLSYIIPIAEGYKDFPSFGFKAKLIDKLYINQIDFSLSYSPNPLIPENERIHFNMKFNYWYWEFFASFNRANFYDLLGPTKRSREGGAIGFKYSDYLLPNRKPEFINYDISAAYLFDLKTMPLYQNVQINADKIYAAEFKIHLGEYRKSLGAIEDESGFEYHVNLSNNYVDNDNFFQVYGQANFGVLLPIRNSSVWLRLYGGKSFGEDGNPFNYFYFGGFGNNYLDNGSVHRFRELSSFPGVSINELPANSFAKATFEWNLPPYRFRNFGFLPAYITYARLSLFSSLLSNTSREISFRNFYYNAGLQVDFELSLFYLLKTYLSFGYALAFKYDWNPREEFMISLKF